MHKNASNKYNYSSVYVQSSANAVAIVDTPICNCSIVSFLQNILTLQLNIQLEHMIVPWKLQPSDLRWNAYRSQAGFSAITALCLSQLDLHLWAGINKAKK